MLNQAFDALDGLLLDAAPARPCPAEASQARPFYAMAEVSQLIPVQALELQAAARLGRTVAAGRPA